MVPKHDSLKKSRFAYQTNEHCISDCSSDFSDDSTPPVFRLTPTQVMNMRYADTVDAKLASFDVKELEAIVRNGEISRKSSAAEYSQNSYLTMLYTQDNVVQDYTKGN
jgi:hypothetical protein